MATRSRQKAINEHNNQKYVSRDERSEKAVTTGKEMMEVDDNEDIIDVSMNNSIHVKLEVEQDEVIDADAEYEPQLSQEEGQDLDENADNSLHVDKNVEENADGLLDPMTMSDDLPGKESLDFVKEMENES